MELVDVVVFIKRNYSGKFLESNFYLSHLFNQGIEKRLVIFRIYEWNCFILFLLLVQILWEHDIKGLSKGSIKEKS